MNEPNLTNGKSPVARQSGTPYDWKAYNKPVKKEDVIINHKSSGLVKEYVYAFDPDKYTTKDTTKEYHYLSQFAIEIENTDSLDVMDPSKEEDFDYTKGKNVLIYTKNGDVINAIRFAFQYSANNQYYKVQKEVEVYNTAYKPEVEVSNEKVVISNEDGYLNCNLIYQHLDNTIWIIQPTAQNGAARMVGELTKTCPADADVNTTTENVNGVPGVYRKVVYALPALESDTRYILKEDVYLDPDIDYGNVDEIVLDGGNLFRVHNGNKTPRKVTCENGAFVDIPSPYTRFCKGENRSLSKSRIVSPDKNTSLSNFGAQSNCVAEFNLMDFVDREDYVPCNSAISINLNSVLDKIFGSVYNISANCQVMVVKMPETHFGGSNFFVERPVIIPYGVTLDLSGAKVHVKDGFKKEFPGMRNEDVKSIYRRDDFVFAFASLPGVKNFVKSKVVNAEIIMSKALVDKGNYPKVVFNLTNFFGEMENVTVNLWRTTDTVAFWQPYGNGQETYSDRKIFRRCQVSNCGWRTKTPTALFCLGNGCVIEQCILGYVAIIGGNSYTIRGCLNDSYFIYDSTVDFTGSYWEVGQFQILDSKVRFAECKLTCDNNNFELRMAQNLRRYLGPWMAVDTDGCRKRLKGFISNMQLGDDYFDQTKGDKNRTQYKGHASIQHSTVVFDPTIRFETVYWGYRQPVSGPVLKIGDETRLIGVENLEAPNHTYIKNDVNATVFNGNVNLANYATIPLVNGTFFNLGRNVDVPTGISIYAYLGNEDLQDKASIRGLDWSGEVFDNISVRIVLDPERKLYSEAYSYKPENEASGQSAITAPDGKEVYISVRILTEEAKKHPNLMVELTFRRKSTDKYYRMRQHFSRVVMGDMVSYGATDLIPSAGNEVIIALFNIAKVYPGHTDKTLLETLCGQELVEGVADDGIFDGVYSNIAGALSDGCGNMCMPFAGDATYSGITLASNLIRTSERNVRAYLLDSALPLHGKWVDGDEVVNKDNILFTLYKKRWYKTSVFTSPITPEISD